MHCLSEYINNITAILCLIKGSKMVYINHGTERYGRIPLRNILVPKLWNWAEGSEEYRHLISRTNKVSGI